MMRHTRLTASLTLLLALAAARTGRSAETPGRDRSPIDNAMAFADFEILVERNIFNAERRARVDSPAFEPREAEPPPPPTERFQLTGALIDVTSTRMQALAFFSGSASDFNRVARPGQKIGEFELLQIRTGGVTLKHGDRKIDLSVGAGMTRSGEEPWELADASEFTRPSEPSRSFGGQPSGFGSRDRSSGFGSRDRSSGFGSRGGPSGFGSRGRDDRDDGDGSSRRDDTEDDSDASADEILKRLMERRRQEMGR